MNLRKGTVIGSVFIIDEKLGSGKCGSVYRAHTAENKDQVVCLKIQTNGVRARQEALAIQKFSQYQVNLSEPKKDSIDQKGDTKGEVKSRLEKSDNDKNNLYKHFFTQEMNGKSVSIFSMPYVKGITLEAFLNLDKKISFVFAKKLVISLIHQLITLHKCGLLHRDLKPNNLIIDFEDKENPQIKIIDLGGAVNLESYSSKEELSAMHFFQKAHPVLDTMGLLNFLGLFCKQFAPEQLDSGSAWQIGRRSDNYSIGRVAKLIFEKCFNLTVKESEMINKIITGLMTVNPMDRMSIEEALFILNPNDPSFQSLKCNR